MGDVADVTTASRPGYRFAPDWATPAHPGPSRDGVTRTLGTALLSSMEIRATSQSDVMLIAAQKTARADAAALAERLARQPATTSPG